METILKESLLNALMNDSICSQELQLPDTDSVTTYITDLKESWYIKGFETAIQLLRNGTLTL